MKEKSNLSCRDYKIRCKETEDNYSSNKGGSSRCRAPSSSTFKDLKIIEI